MQENNYTEEEYLKELSLVIYDEKGEILVNPDLSLGWLEDSSEQNKFGAWRMTQIYHPYSKEEIEKKHLENEVAILRENRKAMSRDEVLDVIIKSQINTLDIPDQTSLRMLEFYPTFEESKGKLVNAGYKFSHDGKLYKTVLSESTIPETFKEGLSDNPSERMLSDTQTYTQIEIDYTGKIYDPIPYNNNRVLYKNKHYIQEGNVYLCNKDSVIAQSRPLKELVGIYVELIDKSL